MVACHHGLLTSFFPFFLRYCAMSDMVIDQPAQGEQGVVNNEEGTLIVPLYQQARSFEPAKVRIARLMLGFEPFPNFWRIPPEMWQEIASFLIDFSPYVFEDMVINNDWLLPVYSWRNFYPENFLAWLWGDRRRVMGPPSTFEGWYQMILRREDWLNFEKIDEMVADMHEAVEEGNNLTAMWCAGRVDKMLSGLFEVYWKAMIAWENIYENELFMAKNQDLAGRPVTRRG